MDLKPMGNQKQMTRLLRNQFLSVVVESIIAELDDTSPVKFSF